MNKTFLGILRKKLLEKKGDWAKELQGVLCMYMMTTKTPIGKTHFSLANGSKVVMPVDIGLSNHRVRHFSKGSNDSRLEEDLDLVEEDMEQVKTQMFTNKRKVEWYFN